MRFFKLPDLGEGLQEAEIVEWHLQAGDTVAIDQLLVSVETAKAIVEVPAPQAGVIERCFGQTGDLLHIGDPLIEYAGEEDAATVAGDIPVATKDSPDDKDFFIVGIPPENKAYAHDAPPQTPPAEDPTTGPGLPLRSTRRTMARAMRHSHQQVADVTLCEDADIHLWPERTDITVRLCRAISQAVAAVPLFNAWFNSEQMRLQIHEDINLGIAVDTDNGLFVPVLRQINRRSDADLREGIDRLRQDVEARTIPPAEMRGATITLSNFGSLTKTANPSGELSLPVYAGRYASPIVTPPCVAIIGAGSARPSPVAAADSSGEYHVEVHRVLPLSLSFDHRVLTGGEAERFLSTCIADLQRAQ
jgi:2-oxoisovalerate dehydrogenase E2 component (dihydrolipoyl transacylase)